MSLALKTSRGAKVRPLRMDAYLMSALGARARAKLEMGRAHFRFLVLGYYFGDGIFQERRATKSRNATHLAVLREVRARFGAKMTRDTNTLRAHGNSQWVQRARQVCCESQAKDSHTGVSQSAGTFFGAR